MDNATDITRGEPASTVYECLASGQALIASTALGPFSWSPPDPPLLAFFIGDPLGESHESDYLGYFDLRARTAAARLHSRFRH